MLQLPRLPFKLSGVRAATLPSLQPDLSSSSSYLFVRRSRRLHHPSRAIFTSSLSRRAQATATQPTKTTASPNAPPNDQSPDQPDAQPLKIQEEDPAHVDWSKSFHGLSAEPFSKEAADVLMAPLSPDDVEIKPDGIIYLPEIKYRRILNRAFGPGGWGLAPRGDTIVTDKAVTREYALLAHGRLVSIARGEQDYFNKDGIPTASEGCKSNAMMRCCKDLGVASELWDPRFIRKWKAEYARDVFVEHQGTKKRTKIWLRKGDPISYPYAEIKR
ncbi:mitochondrial genome maintenance protein MGM101 [Exophiala oligosperma]|uniref:Mitochondrial genome maintenance protein MGM101 n=2 Tax=Chaetothyriales TaxID=34395 RepID=A0A0D2E1X0_9EURO|nr:mitochondrial genome maintenance protein MGM101 [Exophiala oligosperma]KAJ9637118.1 hypothetical protein H2204_005043 [Knufia peltigerae]KIW48795.1 mitochondrial genome maintenance protein MGM101 [Exophiala oligosperma]